MTQDLSDYQDLYISTAKEYIQSLKDSIPTLPSKSVQELEDVHRFAHSLKSQSAVMNYHDISEVAGLIEEYFELVMAGSKHIDDGFLHIFSQIIGDLEKSILAIERKGEPVSLSESIAELKVFTT
jgi:chemotaxis protein histidine kinase CheA